MWPWVARAAAAATSGSMPSRRTSMSATAWTDGVRRFRWRQRERIVGRTSSTEGAHSSQTVRGAGSSTAFRTALADFSFSRSASSTRMICQRPFAGEVNDLRTVSRMSLARISAPMATTVLTSAWVPTSAVWHPSQKPQPGTPPRARSGLTHCRAAAKARAVWATPEPGGPVNSQACVMLVDCGSGPSAAAAVTKASASRAAAASGSHTFSCPTRSSHTVMGHAVLPSHRSPSGPPR